MKATNQQPQRVELKRANLVDTSLFSGTPAAWDFLPPAAAKEELVV